MKNNHIAEEKIVDYTLGQLSDEDLLQVHTHIHHCSYCAMIAKYWTDSLEKNNIAKQSKSLNESIYISIHKKKQRRKKLAIYGIIAASLLFFIGLSTFQTKTFDQINQTKKYHTDYIIDIAENKNFVNYLKVVSKDLSKYSNDQYNAINSSLQLMSAQYISKNQLESQVFLHRDGSLCILNGEQSVIDCYTLIINKNDHIIPVKRETYKYIIH